MIEIDLTFSLEGESNDFPSPETLAQGIYDGLPKEWYSYQDDGDYKVIGIVGKDETERRHDNIRLKATVGIRDHQIEVLTAELMQERKLVQHLDGQVVNLIEKNDNQVTIVDAQRTRIHGLIGDADQRNDVITGLRGELFATDKKLKERTESLDVSQHEWEVKQADLNTMTANYHEAEAEGDGARANADRLAADLQACQATNRSNLGESKVGEEMVAKIVDAMQGAGYDISGWGNDTDLTDLENAATVIEDELQAARKSLTDTIIMINDVADKGNDIDVSLDTVSSEVDILSVKLDEIRTER